MKHIFTLLLFAIFLVGCGHSSESQLKKDILELNAHCPIDMGMMGTMSSASYEEAEKSVNFFYTISEDLIDLDALRQNEDLVKNTLKLSASKSDSKYILEEITKAGASLSLHFKYSSSPLEQLIVTLSNSELQELVDSPLSDREINSMLLANQIAMENARCPYWVDEGLLMTEVKDNGSEVIYYCKTDENLYDMDVLEDLKYEMKKEMVELFNDPMMKRQIEMLSYLNKGYRFVYYGDRTGKRVAVVFTPSELNQFLNQH